MQARLLARRQFVGARGKSRWQPPWGDDNAPDWSEPRLQHGLEIREESQRRKELLRQPPAVGQEQRRPGDRSASQIRDRIPRFPNGEKLPTGSRSGTDFQGRSDAGLVSQGLTA